MSRPTVSSAAHTARGTYRKDRHAGGPTGSARAATGPPRADTANAPDIEPLAALGDAGRAVWESLLSGYADVIGTEDAAILTNIAALADFVAQTENAIDRAPDDRRAQFIRATLNARTAYTRELARFTAHCDLIRRG